MIRVYVDMVADLFHPGHVEFLRQAKELGDWLIVGVHSDETAACYKRHPVMTMHERVRMVEACRYVDQVIPAAPLVIDRFWIERHRIDLVAHGDDFDEETMQRYYRTSHELGILRSLPYTSGISTTDLISRIRSACDQPT